MDGMGTPFTKSPANFKNALTLSANGAGGIVVVVEAAFDDVTVVKLLAFATI